MPAKLKVIKHLEVGEFFERNGNPLDMHLVGPPCGLNRRILEPSVNRPGLALAGFFEHFAFKRVQVIGHSEMAYLSSRTPEDMAACLNRILEWEIPCLVICRGLELPLALRKLVSKAEIPLFRSGMDTMHYISAAAMKLEWEFAPTTLEHGCMVDVRGIGVLVRGSSGSGKSETVLGLMERGHSLVADDAVLYRAPVGQELIGTAKEMARYHMEVRGLGLVNALPLFGIGAIRNQKRLDLVVTLELGVDLSDMERVGIADPNAQPSTYPLLGRNVPHVRLPVAPGRDMARLVEVAALEYKLRGLGVHAAEELSKKLLQSMTKS